MTNTGNKGVPESHVTKVVLEHIIEGSEEKLGAHHIQQGIMTQNERAR